MADDAGNGPWPLFRHDPGHTGRSDDGPGPQNPEVRWFPLDVDGPQDYGIARTCERCTVCTRFCPAEAIHEEKQLVGGIERWHIDTGACEPYFLQLWGCKICLTVRPYNGRGIFKESYKAPGRDIAKTKNAAGIMNLFASITAEASQNPFLLAFRNDQIDSGQQTDEAAKIDP